MKHDLEALKAAFTIPEIWRRLGLAGTPGSSCRSPFREDRSASFSIYEDGRRWKDHATDEGGDVIDFIARACAVDTPEATRRFITMSGGEAPLQILPPARPPATARTLILPPLHCGTVAELEGVAHSRSLSAAAIGLAQSLPTLAFGEVCGQAAWILHDEAGRIAEARRVDRKPFPAIGDLCERKAHTLRGSVKNWPVGVAVLQKLPSFRAVVLVEGGPDYLAALHFCLARDIHDILPIAMLGRSVGARLAPDALALLRGRNVRIYPHDDADGGGRASAEVWATQLHGVGCDVDVYSFAGLSRQDGKPVKDLNDCALIASSDEPQLIDLLP